MCVMSALLRCPSCPCHNGDTGISTKNKSPSLSVTYKGYKECTRTIGCRTFTSNAAFPEKCDEFSRLGLSSIVGSKTFQFLTGLVFDYCEPIGEDREHPIFGSDGVSPHLPSRVGNKFDEFFRFELSSIVGSKTFQFSTGLIFDHCEPIKED